MVCLRGHATPPPALNLHHPACFAVLVLTFTRAFQFPSSVAVWSPLLAGGLLVGPGCGAALCESGVVGGMQCSALPCLSN